jgi:anti-sigma factor RsiW
MNKERVKQLAAIRAQRDAYVAAFTNLGREPVTQELIAQAIDSFELRLLGACAVLTVNHDWVNP